MYKLIPYEAKRFTTGLSDVLTTVYRNGTVVESGVASEQGATGVYFYPFTSTSAGSYLAITDSATQPQLDSTAWTWDTSAGTVDALTINTSYLHVKHRLGDVESNLGAGSANIVSLAISGAQAEIDQLTGNATGTLVTFAVAELAAGKVVDTLLGRDDLPVSNDRVNMAKNLKENSYKMVSSYGHDVRYKIR